MTPMGILQFFQCDHLPPAQREISQFFRDLANTLAEKLPDNPEKTVSLRKLLESKDCAVRASLYRTLP